MKRFQRIWNIISQESAQFFFSIRIEWNGDVEVGENKRCGASDENLRQK